jgi:hypothetical protein
LAYLGPTNERPTFPKMKFPLAMLSAVFCIPVPIVLDPELAKFAAYVGSIAAITGIVYLNDKMDKLILEHRTKIPPFDIGTSSKDQ